MSAESDDRSRLLRALTLSQRFHLFLAYCASPRAADQLQRALEHELPRSRRAPVRFVILDPYEDRASDAPLDERDLTARILNALLAPPPEHRAHGVVHVINASRAARADTQAWGTLFALWNEKRNALQQLSGEVLVILPESLKRVFATSAPDVWSIRSGEYAIDEAAGLEVTEVFGAEPAPRTRTLDWYRAIPPLALFGGDLLVRPWLQDIVPDADVEDLAGEPVFRSGGVAHERALVQRDLRNAEHALGHRRFKEAEQRLRRALQSLDTDREAETRRRAGAALMVVLAAEDRADEALALIDSGVVSHGPGQRGGLTSALGQPGLGWLPPLKRATGYARWCLGHFFDAYILEPIGWGYLVGHHSDVLRWAERGEIANAERSLPALSEVDPTFVLIDEGNQQLIAVDTYFLTGNLTKAAALSGQTFADFDALRIDDKTAAEVRFDALRALVELARGDRLRAVSLLSHPRPPIARTREPEMQHRVHAFHAYASGLVQAHGPGAEDAIDWFARARGHIAEWARTGLDRRSLRRASLAVDLAHAALDPAPDDPVVIARELVRRGVELLGDTAEDFVARVLTVEAHRELARRLANKQAAFEAAHRALELSRPLAGRGAPAWDAIAADTEREALTLSTR